MDEDADLIEELIGFCPSSTAVTWLRDRMGIPSRVLHGRRGWVGCGRIITDGAGYFQPHPDGEPAIVIPIGEPGWPDGWLHVDDMVAFRPSAPSKWWLRRGAVTFASEIAIDLARQEKLPIKLLDDPLQYLKSDPEGLAAVVLDWGQFNPRDTFDGLTVECSPYIESRLRQRLAEMMAPTFEIRRAA